MTDEQVAQELEIDYAGALTGRVYREFNNEVHVVDEIPYDETLPIITAWDYGVGTTAIAILQETATSIDQIGELEVHDAIPDNVVPALLDTLADLGVPLQELEPQFTREWLGVGDPAGDAASSSSRRSGRSTRRSERPSASCSAGRRRTGSAPPPAPPRSSTGKRTDGRPAATARSRRKRPSRRTTSTTT
jgi:hypothetical protein